MRVRESARRDLNSQARIQRAEAESFAPGQRPGLSGFQLAAIIEHGGGVLSGYHPDMTDEERKEAIRRHVAICLAEREHAEDGLAKIKAGRTHHEAERDEPAKNVTEERANRFRKIIERMDSILETYRRWNA